MASKTHSPQRLARVENHCARHRLKFTPLRRRVLEILLESDRALGAYEILGQLQAEGIGFRPPVAYRPLEFLVKYGFAHRIERLNAYVACSSPCRAHVPAFMICRICDGVTETTPPPFDVMLDATARRTCFQIEQTVVEVIGICPRCHKAGTA